MEGVPERQIIKTNSWEFFLSINHKKIQEFSKKLFTNKKFCGILKSQEEES